MHRFKTVFLHFKMEIFGIYFMLSQPRLAYFIFYFVLAVWSSHQRCSVNKMFLEVSQNSQENTVPETFFCLRPATLFKKSLAQVFSCEFSEISKNTFFPEHLRTTTSEPCPTFSPSAINDWVQKIQFGIFFLDCTLRHFCKTLALTSLICQFIVGCSFQNVVYISWNSSGKSLVVFPMSPLLCLMHLA